VYKGHEDVLFSRRDLLGMAQDNFEQSPWFGYGFGTSVGEAQRSTDWQLQNLSGREKGNAYMALLEEVGAVGTAVLLLPVFMFLASWRKLVRVSRRSSKRTAAIAAAAWAGAFAGLLHNNAEATLWSPGAMFGTMLLFLAGAADGMLSESESLG
jgi:O-antigen ligase